MASDTPPAARTIALRSIVRSQLAETKPHGISLLYEIGSLLTPGGRGPGVPSIPLAAVGNLNGEIGNGGLSQYFFNSSGNDWQAALHGLELLGDAEGTAILKAALAAFGPGGPPTERADRQRFEALVAANSSRFDDLDRRWYLHEDALGGLFTTWLSANLDDLCFPPLAELVRTFQFHGWSQQQDVFQPVIDLLEKSPRNRSCGWESSDLGSVSSTINSCLMSERDELNIVALDSSDPHCAVALAAVGPLASAVHLRCIVIGPATVLTVRPEMPWLLLVPDTGQASLERVRNWLGPELWNKD